MERASDALFDLVGPGGKPEQVRALLDAHAPVMRRLGYLGPAGDPSRGGSGRWSLVMSRTVGSRSLP